MKPADAQPTRYRFRDCLLDLKRRELVVQGQVVPLQPRAFDMLALLVRRAGEVLSKDQLIAEVWPTTHVTDAVLATAAARIRRAIGDTAADDAALRTVHGVGYRFDAVVQPDAAVPAPVAPDEPRLPPESAPMTLQPAATGAPMQTVPAGAPGPEGPATGLLEGLAAESADPGFWALQRARAVQLEATGEVLGALDLMSTLRAQLPPSAEDALLMARLLRQRLQLTRAQAEVAHGLALTADPGLQAALRLEGARIALLRRDQAAAAALLDEVAEHAVAAPLPEHLLPELVFGKAQLHLLREELSRARLLLDGMVSVLRCPRDARLLADADLRCSFICSRLGLSADAVRHARQALAIAQREGLPVAAAAACRRLGLEATRLGDMAAGLRFLRRAALVIGERADLGERAQVAELEATVLVWLGRLDEARRVLEPLSDEALHSEAPLTRNGLGVARALLSWRSGHMSDAVAQLERLIEENALDGISRHGINKTHARLALYLGDPAPARRLLQAEGAALLPAAAAMLQAGIDLLEGRREAAKRPLRRAWGMDQGVGGQMLDVVLSLAFLQIEDQEPAGLEDLMAAVRGQPIDRDLAPLVEVAYQLRQAQDGDRLRAFLDQARRHCGLIHRHAWLLEETGALRWARGERRLGELLPHACF